MLTVVFLIAVFVMIVEALQIGEKLVELSLSVYLNDKICSWLST